MKAACAKSVAIGPEAVRGNMYFLDTDYSLAWTYDISMGHPQTVSKSFADIEINTARQIKARLQRRYFPGAWRPLPRSLPLRAEVSRRAGHHHHHHHPRHLLRAGSEPGQAGLPPGQGGFAIHSSTTQFNSAQQGIAGSMEGVVDGLMLTAVGAPDRGRGGRVLWTRRVLRAVRDGWYFG